MLSLLLLVCTTVLPAAEPGGIGSTQTVDSRPLHELKNTDLAAVLAAPRVEGGKAKAPEVSIADFAKRAVGQPYRREAKHFALDQADCVTFTEHAIAMGLSTDWPSYYRIAQRLRHKDGVPQFLEANFLVLPDWVENNAWLLEDITAKLGPTEQYSHPLFRRELYEKLSFGEDANSETGRRKKAAKEAKLQNLSGSERLTDVYLPVRVIPEIEPQLKSGDVCLVIRSKPLANGRVTRFCDHLGIIERTTEGQTFLLHAAPPAARRDSLRKFLKTYTAVVGLKFVRLKSNPAERVASEMSRIENRLPVVTAGEIDSKLMPAQSK